MDFFIPYGIIYSHCSQSTESTPPIISMIGSKQFNPVFAYGRAHNQWSTPTLSLTWASSTWTPAQMLISHHIWPWILPQHLHCCRHHVRVISDKHRHFFNITVSFLLVLCCKETSGALCCVPFLVTFGNIIHCHILNFHCFAEDTKFSPNPSINPLWPTALLTSEVITITQKSLSRSTHNCRLLSITHLLSSSPPSAFK